MNQRFCIIHSCKFLKTSDSKKSEINAGGIFSKRHLRIDGPMAQETYMNENRKTLCSFLYVSFQQDMNGRLYRVTPRLS